MKTIVLTALISLGAIAPAVAMTDIERNVIISGEPVHSDDAQAIFDRLKAESAENE